MSIAMPASPSQPSPPESWPPHESASAAARMGPTGRLRHEGLGDADRNFAVAIHLSPLLASTILGPLGLLVPLVLWLVRKDQSGFVDDHGREVMNFGISFVLLHVILMVTIVGFVAIPVLWIVAIINVIRGAVAAGSSEYFRYPLTLRFLS